jgi:hypothetical protein
MLFRWYFKILAGVGLLAAVWGLGTIPAAVPHVRIRSAGAPRGPVRILRFYATVGTIVPGQKAQLCYGVENARSVRISPVMPNIYPTANRCLEIVPEHTTHYTLLAEGFDGNVDTRFFTLEVQSTPEPARQVASYAEVL